MFKLLYEHNMISGHEILEFNKDLLWLEGYLNRTSLEHVYLLELLYYACVFGEIWWTSPFESYGTGEGRLTDRCGDMCALAC